MKHSCVEIECTDKTAEQNKCKIINTQYQGQNTLFDLNLAASTG